MRAFLALALTVLLAGCALNDIVPDTRLVVGVDILTLNGDPAPEAMLIEQGRITAFGSEDQLRARNPGAVLTDLTGKTVVPGFVDSHVHVVEFADDALKVDLSGVRSVDEMVIRLQADRTGLEPDDWIVGQGWDEAFFADRDGPGGYPTASALDAAFPDRPVLLESRHGLASLANQAALDAAGIGPDTPDPQGGTILRGEDGQATGVLLALAQTLVTDARPELAAEKREAALLEALSQLAEAGVTSIHETEMGPEDIALFQALADSGRLPLRVYGLLDGRDEDLVDPWFERGPLRDPDSRFEIGAVKLFYDGSLGSRTALLRAPYRDRPDAATPTARIPLARLETLGVRALETGFQMAVHAIGDEANDNVLTSFERVLGDQAGTDHRWRIEHVQVVSQTFAERAAALGIIASMPPSHAIGDRDWAEDRLGPRRIRRAYAWRTLQNANVPVIFNSGLPGEPWMPLQTLHFATTRTDLEGQPEGGWYPEQAFDRAEALHAMTLGGARAAFQEDEIGSLEVGKWADFVVLSANPLTTEDVLSIKVEATYIAGRRVTSPEEREAG